MSVVLTSWWTKMLTDDVPAQCGCIIAAKRCIWCQRLMPTMEVLAEVMEESGKGITVATVDCTVHKNLCTNRFPIRVRTD